MGLKVCQYKVRNWKCISVFAGREDSYALQNKSLLVRFYDHVLQKKLKISKNDAFSMWANLVEVAYVFESETAFENAQNDISLKSADICNEVR